MLLKETQIINDRFELKNIIGAGSFGEVWLAKDNVLGIDVAIKFYVALDSRGIEEFKHEFRTVYTLYHPNLLRPDYFDSIGRNPYLVMAFCPKNAGDRVGTMGREEIWKFILDVSAGLEYLHNKDIIHRDIKTDNILCNEYGDYVITDFGLSTKMRATLRKASMREACSSSNSGGTIGYMAPEMFTSTPQPVKATDIWAFGATVYELMTGELPFCGQGGVMVNYGAELPAVPTKYGPELTSLIHKCLAKEPWDRLTAAQIHEIARLQVSGKTKQESSFVKDESQYINELESLKIKLEKEKQYSDSNGITDLRKSNKIFKFAFSVSVLLLMFSILFTFLRLNSVTDGYESRILALNSDLEHSRQLVDRIKNVCDNGASNEYEVFPDWTSSNHEHNSVGVQNYMFYAYRDDVISFDYNVDSESYDHFICYLTSSYDTINIADISGDKTGFLKHKVKDSQNYELQLIYKKDCWDNIGRDRVSISNIKLERSDIGEISRLIKEYFQEDCKAETEPIPMEENDADLRFNEEFPADSVAVEAI